MWIRRLNTEAESSERVGPHIDGEDLNRRQWQWDREQRERQVRNISSIVTLATEDGSREAILRVPTIDPRRAVDALESHGYTVRGAHRQ